MPATSPAQERLMQAAAHTPGGYGGVPQAVGKEFTDDAPAPVLQPIGDADAPDTLDELGIARAIRDGTLKSPTYFHNMALFALRITGTGAAYRRSHEEYAWRDPAVYLTDEFLARCNGLAVIIEHPGGPSLTSDEFQERVIGAILLPYIQGDEVWGIAKIYDEAAIKMMSEHQLSTSPGVVFLDPDVNTKTTMADGSTLLIEGKPSVLDHLAVCELGVWDKGGAPAGVKTDIRVEGKAMTEEEQAAADRAKKDADEKAKAEEAAKAEREDKARKDAEASAKLDKIMAACDSFGSRLDALERGRRDADNSDDPEDIRKMPEETVEDRAKKDAARKDWKAKKDAQAKKDAEEKEKMAREDAARKDAEDLRAQVAAMQSKLPKQISDADYAAMADAQARADKVYSAFGDSAPRPLQGEDLIGYRRRLAGGLKKHSKDWKDVDLATVDAGVLGIAEARVYHDAMDVALHPVDLPEGTLREITTTDSTGRRISTFVGEPRAWMSAFSSNRRRLAGIRNGSR